MSQTRVPIIIHLQNCKILTVSTAKYSSLKLELSWIEDQSNSIRINFGLKVYYRMKFVIKPGFEIIDHRMIHLQGPQKANNNQPEELIINSTWPLTEPRAESLNMKKKNGY